jgi:hypothetical protein
MAGSFHSTPEAGFDAQLRFIGYRKKGLEPDDPTGI